MTAVERYDAPQWDVIQQQADILARSSFVPRAFRGRPGDIVAVALIARELDLPPIGAMSLIDVIDGNPTLSAEGKVAVVRGRGHSITGESGPTQAIARGRRCDTGDTMEVTWTIDMAKAAGLTGKDGWRKYPTDMMWSRAVSTLCRRLFPDILAGLSYTPEEVEAFVGSGGNGPGSSTSPALPPAETGEITARLERTPASVEQAKAHVAEARSTLRQPPKRTETPTEEPTTVRPAGAGGEADPSRLPDGVEVVSPEDIAELRQRAGALPEPFRRQCSDEVRVAVGDVEKMPAARVGDVEAIVAHYEDGVRLANEDDRRDHAEAEVTP